MTFFLVAKGVLLLYAIIAGLRARWPRLPWLLVPALFSFVLPLLLEVLESGVGLRQTLSRWTALAPALGPAVGVVGNGVLAFRAFGDSRALPGASSARPAFDGLSWALLASTLLDGVAVMFPLLSTYWRWHDQT